MDFFTRLRFDWEAGIFRAQALCGQKERRRIRAFFGFGAPVRMLHRHAFGNWDGCILEAFHQALGDHITYLNIGEERIAATSGGITA